MQSQGKHVALEYKAIGEHVKMNSNVNGRRKGHFVQGLQRRNIVTVYRSGVFEVKTIPLIGTYSISGR